MTSFHQNPNHAAAPFLTAAPGKPTLNFTQAGNSLQFTWTGSYKLQAQTNSVGTFLSNNWGDYPGGNSSGVTVPIDATQGAVFLRLAPTP